MFDNVINVVGIVLANGTNSCDIVEDKRNYIGCIQYILLYGY